MATLIPALGSCAARMTPGERRLAERLEQKLEDDYLLWYDVPVGPQQLHPDFIVLHPSRGLLILEVKDFRLTTIVQADKNEWTILDSASGEPVQIQSPFSQARTYAHSVCDALRALHIKDTHLATRPKRKSSRGRCTWPTTACPLASATSWALTELGMGWRRTIRR